MLMAALRSAELQSLVQRIALSRYGPGPITRDLENGTLDFDGSQEASIRLHVGQLVPYGIGAVRVRGRRS